MPEGVELFSRRTTGRKSGDLLFVRDDGVAWNKDNLQKPLAEALERAGLSGTFYGLRHSHVSFALSQGLSIKAVSSNAGASLAMLQTHYAHILDRDRLEAFTNAGFGGGVDATVVKLDQAKG